MGEPEISLAVQRLSDNARLPTKGHPSDLGWDLYASVDVELQPSALARINTGIAIEFPPGTGGLVKDRSSMAIKGIHCLAGVIDPDYRGEIIIVAANLGPDPISIRTGERCAQLILVQTLPATVTETDSVDSTVRGQGGFGSTGR